MELSFFHLERHPFVGTPSVRQLFWNPEQQRVLQTLAYGIEGRKEVITLVGARGMGKTTLLDSYLKRRRQQNIRTIVIPGVGCSFNTVLERVCQEFEVPVIVGDSDTTLRRLREALNREYAEGARTILILDGAESIALPVLESLLILADMKDESGSLLQIFVLAEPALLEHVKEAGATALLQRLGTPIVLQPFSSKESRAYVQHRIAEVALRDDLLFTPSALNRIIRYAKGNPGILNYICSETMGQAMNTRQKPINTAIVREVLDELTEDESVPWLRWGLVGLASVAVGLGLYLGGSALGRWGGGSQTTAAVNEPIRPAAVDPPPRLLPSESKVGETGEPVAVEPPPAAVAAPGMSKAMARAAGLPIRGANFRADNLTPQVTSPLVVEPSEPVLQPESGAPSLDAVDPQDSSLGRTPETVKSVVCLAPRPAGNRRRDIILVDAAGKVRQRLVSDGALNLAPILSPDGRTLAYTSYREGTPSIYLRNLASAQEERLTLRPGFAMPGSWAPNGRYLVLSKSESGNSDIFLYDTQRRHLRRLTLHKGIDISPSFAPDSKRLVFTSNRTGSSQIYLTDVEGQPPTRLTSNGNYNTSAVWSPRGDTIAFIGRSADKTLNIYTIRADGTGLRQVTQGDRTIEETPSWAPDGQSIMYTRVRDSIRERRIIRADGRDDRELPGHGPVCYSPQWVAQN